ncbi:MAG TPA: hypothetical protein VH518_06890 [Tepidisphaeraceae bacterium]|jgi:hypothetical protein
MAWWIVEGTCNSAPGVWKIKAADEAAARRFAATNGVRVSKIVAEGTIVSKGSSSSSISVRPNLPAAPNQQVTAVRSLERCANCDAPIGRLEVSHVWQDVVVCSACYGKLTVSPQQPAASPPAPAQIVMMPAPTPPPATPHPSLHVSSAPVIHLNTTNINRNVVPEKRGCIGSLIHAIAVLIAIVIFLLGVLALVGYLMSVKWPVWTK